MRPSQATVQVSNRRQTSPKLRDGLQTQGCVGGLVCQPLYRRIQRDKDASYFGTWANPAKLLMFSYCEGDTTLKEAATPDEFAAELLDIDAWTLAHGYGPARIDPGFDPQMKAAVEGPGLADMLH